jgi:hypothetical protein
VATAFYVVDWADYHVDAGPTGYEDARVLYGPLASREECGQVWDPALDEDGVIVEMDRGDDAPEVPAEDPGRAAGVAREALARRVEQLAEFWASVSPGVREAVDAECGGLVPSLDVLVDAASEVDDDEQEVTTGEFGEVSDQLDAAQAEVAALRAAVTVLAAEYERDHYDLPTSDQDSLREVAARLRKTLEVQA